MKQVTTMNETLVTLMVNDLSANGTYVNGELLGRGNHCTVRPGDKISLAGCVAYLIKPASEISDGPPKRKSFFECYVLGESLGTGHYAEVKEALNKKTTEICAVKIFHPQRADIKNSKSIQLDRELEVLMSINHPNIVRFYEKFYEPVDHTTFTTYLVLEKVNGGELFQRIVRKQRLRQDETNALFKQLLSGLKYLHSRGIVHRDIKPENILLDIKPRETVQQTQTGPWDENELDIKVKIADFGLAKVIGQFNFTTTLCGTPAYVAPEVLRSNAERMYNKAVDLWSTGVLLYVCLCGFPPFSEELGPPSMKQQILQGRYAFFSEFWNDISDEALDLVARLLVVDPNERLTVEEATQHVWFRKESSEQTESLSREQLYTFEAGRQASFQDMRARAMTVRIPTRALSSPMTLQQKFTNGVNNDDDVDMN
ncbi:unnamed protein product [Kuraishia capsulata CBS 1993]|uniref:Protein kinase domain-containing protein n=1 Tax=Kuraishia capsulata CBS 1993 TaxID=1382522 RepID=W6MMA9_9ASCO|nr:uncharacterized protein KUCA_T00003693001 [Kuraishia capsulata CBS 1993]CDK27714.1 unnamed protein product [Kuraishia capsulata CBS 1993]